MEKNLNNLENFSNIPAEIQQHIAAYLDAPALGFFAQSNKKTLKNILPVLRNYQASFPLQLAVKGHSAYFYKANQLFVCGRNDGGQLGLEDKKDRHVFTAVLWPVNRGRIQQVVTGVAHTFVLTQDNQLWACGYNHFGQLGLGSTADCSTLLNVPWPKERGKILQIAAGESHTIILTENNSLWICGYSAYGQLELEDQINRTIFTAVPWPNERGKIQQVIAGSQHTLVLTENNSLWVCGYNTYGQLGVGDRTPRYAFTALPWPEERGKILQITAGESHTVILSEENRLWVCGFNFYGQLGMDDQIDRSVLTNVPWPEEQGVIKQIIAGFYHTILLTQDNRLWTCGNNDYGQLGMKNYNQCSTFTAVPWPVNQGKIQQVIAGWHHTFILTSNNKLWGCGTNEWGQLGLNNLEYCTSLKLVDMKKLCPALEKVFRFENNLNQLFKLDGSLNVTHLVESQTPATLSPRKCSIQ